MLKQLWANDMAYDYSLSIKPMSDNIGHMTLDPMRPQRSVQLPKDFHMLTGNPSLPKDTHSPGSLSPRVAGANRRHRMNHFGNIPTPTTTAIETSVSQTTASDTYGSM
ncbi:hypothetical protein K449DRAFT_399163 [Hypoxylon sp. EC38]|nr:hypothetical protein K449DRAFT_399163 [Hypoxylon sp. EC38]